MIPEPPQLAPSDVKKQRLYSEVPLDVQTISKYPISKAESSQPSSCLQYLCINTEPFCKT